ncbi:MAG: hypothetical protein AAF560_01170 [Acidobacteriota bacterium]
MSRRKGSGQSAFAMTFSDLMMGATGVVIVMLLLLSAVRIRGFGTEVMTAETSFSPGLRQALANPVARIRLVVRPGRWIQSLQLQGLTVDGSEVLSLAAEADMSDVDVGVKEWILLDGLKSRELSLVTDEPLEGIFISVTVFIAGTWIPRQWDDFQVSARDLDEPLARIALSFPEIIRRP